METLPSIAARYVGFAIHSPAIVIVVTGSARALVGIIRAAPDRRIA